MPEPAEHPEQHCERCGGVNPVWFVDSDRWNLAVGDDTHLILCPGCFVAAHEKATGLVTVWRLVPDQGGFRRAG